MGSKTTKVQFYLPNDVMERINEISKAADVEPTKLMVNMLDEFSKTLNAAKCVGLLQISVLIRNAGEKLHEWVEDINKKVKIEGIDKK